MRKRISCLLMTLAMLISLIPAAAVPAYASSKMSSSEEVIDFIKKFEGFSATAFWDVNQWSIGYGTAGYMGQTMTQAQADRAMREQLEKIDAKINKFADTYDLDFSQNEHDALASLSFNCGTTWMTTEGRFRDAVIEGEGENDFLFYISLWANINSVPDRSLIKRRLCEANIYFNGEYTKSIPDDYSYVILDPNGGVAGHGGEDKMQGYLLSAGAPIMANDPKKSGTSFIGWFTERVGGEEVTRLDESTALATLYAHYDGDAEEDEDYSEVIATGTVRCDTYVNVRKGAGTGYALSGSLVNGSKIQIYEIKTVGSSKWGRIKAGWICLDYVRMDDNNEPEEEDRDDSSEKNGIVVNANVVNVRKAAGTSSPVVTTLKLGTQVTVYQQTTKDNAPWGRIDEGWICLNYVRMYSDTDDAPEDDDEITGTGRVSSNTNLNVRSGPGTDYGRVNFLSPGTRVTVYETRTVRGERWGRIGDKRWVCLTYVRMDSNSNEEAEDEPEEEQRSDEVLYTGRVSSRTVLNVRSGPGTNYGRVKTLSPGSVVRIYEETERQGMTWGRIDEKNWVCLSYITTGDNIPEREEPDEDDDEEETDGEKGVVTGDTVLNIRSGAGTGYPIVGSLTPGTKVTILDQKRVNQRDWGRIERGWICLDYVDMD